MSTSPAELVQQLLDWYRASHRELPWRRNADPYRVWVSEVMLQQTRVEAVLPYYERFLRRFPTVESLASAPGQEVLAKWAGLGYYRRARMLHDAAKRIVGDFGGQWPADYRTMRSLPGIGEYTAAAIASIAFDQPRAALDGNGLRVLARFADDRRDIRGAACRRALKVLAGSLMETVPPGQRGAFTQALMELGATVCIPRAPRCLNCPWKAACAGFASGAAPELPVKGPRRVPRRVEISIVIARRGDWVLARQRPADSSIMPGFWELPTVESRSGEGSDQWPVGLRQVRRLGAFTHAITNTNYACRVCEARANPSLVSGYRWVEVADLRRMPLTTISKKALRFVAGTVDQGEVP